MNALSPLHWLWYNRSRLLLTLYTVLGFTWLDAGSVYHWPRWSWIVYYFVVGFPLLIWFCGRDLGGVFAAVVFAYFWPFGLLVAAALAWLQPYDGQGVLQLTKDKYTSDEKDNISEPAGEVLDEELLDDHERSV